MRALLAFLLLLLSAPIFASSCANYDQALAQEQAWQNSCPSGQSCSASASSTWVDGNNVFGDIMNTITDASGNSYSAGYYQWACPVGYTPPPLPPPPSKDPAGDQCKAQPAQPFPVSGGSMNTCSGGCGYAFSPGKSSMVVSQVGSGKAVTFAQLYPTGATCDSSGSITNTSDSSVPKEPSSYNPAPAETPRLCGSGSCFDPRTKTAYYTTSDGVQHSVDTSNAGCGGSGGTTVCVGDPPPMPSASQASDPTKQITASDTYSSSATDAQGDKSASQTTVNVYNQPGSSSTSGATSSDAGNTPSSNSPSSSSSSPASASSSGKDGGSVSGGGDCGSPPICSGGDAVECAVLSQTWETRCQTAKVANDMDASGLTGLSPESGNSQAVSVATQELSGDPQSAGLDDSGWGFSNKCPIQPVTYTLLGQSILFDMTKVCTFLGYMSIFVLITAYVVAARIIMD